MLNPGEHYFVGQTFSLGGNATLTGSDAVIILKDQATVSIGGNATLSLDGRKAGPYAGFVLMSDRSFSGTVSISAKTAKRLHGTVYLPGATLDVKGNNKVADQSPWTIVVAKSVSLGGSADLVINADYAGSSVPVPTGIGPGVTRLLK